MARFVRVPEARTTSRGGRALKKVLVVEDEASIAGLIAYNLEQAGYRVQTGTDGQAACRQAETFAPDAGMLDLLLPLVSGWQVLRFLRSHADRRLARVPVIVVSALGSARQRAELKRQGAQDCLEKPFSVAELSRLIHVHTSRATAGDGWRPDWWKRRSSKAAGVSSSPRPSPIRGETGLGHVRSRRFFCEIVTC